MHLSPLAASDAADVDALLDEAFGPDRFRKTAYRLREGSAPVAAASFVARRADGVLCGVISFWPVTLVGPKGARLRALLLGPIAVAEACRGQGLGAMLIEAGLSAARMAGHELICLVGDESYYGRFGFSNAQTALWRLPGPVDQDRVLALALAGSAVPAGPFDLCGPLQDGTGEAMAISV